MASKLCKFKTISMLLVVITLLSMTVYGATNWVQDPTDCPSTDATNFPGQNCDTEDICGDNSGIAQCYDTSAMSYPAGNSSSQTNWHSGVDGGYVLNCYATVDASEPYCDNSGSWWCDRSSTCYNVNRLTWCMGGGSTTQCAYCRSGYTYCDGDYEDEDGCEIDIDTTPYPGEANAVYNSTCNPACSGSYLDCDGDLGTAGTGCEILNGGTCYVGGLEGVYSGCSGGSGNCVVSKSYFETGTKTNYSTTLPMLWGQQYGTGHLISFANSTNVTFNLTQSLCLQFPDSTLQCTASSPTVDTNETTRFNTLIGNCTSGQVVRGILQDGSISCELDDVGEGGSQWVINPTDLRNNTGILGLNWSTINDTIDARENHTDLFYPDTIWTFLSPRLINESGSLNINETWLNATIDARENHTDLFYPNTVWDIFWHFINVSNVLQLNMSWINETIDARENHTDIFYLNETLRIDNLVAVDCGGTEKMTGISTNGSIICDIDQTIPDTDTNETTRFNTLIGNCTSGQVVRGILQDGSISCELDDVGEGGSQWVINPTDLYNNTGILGLNWSTINDTIDARENHTDLFYPDTNETARFDFLTGTDCSGMVVVGVADNGSIVCEADDSGSGGIEGIAPWLSNTSTNITFNATKLRSNQTGDGASLIGVEDEFEFWASDELEAILNEVGAYIGADANATWRDPVLDKDLNEPPGSPSTGDRYIVSSAGYWFDDSFSYRQEFIVNSQSENYSYYPISIYLNNSNPLWHNCTLPKCADHAFTDMNHEAIVFYEEIIDSELNQTMYVVSPRYTNSSQNTSVWMYYGSSEALYSASDDPFTLYYDTYIGTTDGSDKSGNGHSITSSVGSPTTYYLESHGQGTNFSQSGDAWSLACSSCYYELGYTDRTWNFYLTTHTDVTNMQVFYGEGGTTNGVAGYILGGKLYFFVWTSKASSCTTAGTVHEVGVYDISADSDYYVTATFDSDGNQTFGYYVNGNLANISTTTTGISAHSGDGGIGYTGTNTKCRHDFTQISAGEYADITLWEFSTHDRFVNISEHIYQYNLLNNSQPVYWGGQEEPTGASGDWAGHEDHITEYNGATWDFEVPSAGWTTFVQDESQIYTYDAEGYWSVPPLYYSHNNLGGLQGGNPPVEAYHLTLGEYTSATRDATDSQNGLFPAGKMQIYDDTVATRIDYIEVDDGLAVIEDNNFVFEGGQDILVSLITDLGTNHIRFNYTGSASNSWWDILQNDIVNNSNVLELNWTTINATIDARAGSGDTNETERVNNLASALCDAGQFASAWDADLSPLCSTPTYTIDTRWTLFEQDIWNNTGNLNLNWTTINATIDARELDTNETTRMSNIAGNVCTIGQFVNAFNIDGSPICATPSYIADTDTWWNFNVNHLVNNSNILGLNFTTINSTVNTYVQENNQYVDIGGDNMTGDLNMTNNNIYNVDCIYFNNGGEICDL